MFAPLGLPQASLTMLCDQQHTLFEAHLASAFPAADRLIAECEGKRIGRLVIDRPGQGEWHLADIILDSAARGCGFGTVLLERLTEEARAARQPLSLMVAADNLRAIALYERLGFYLAAGGSETHRRMVRQPTQA